MQIYIYIYIMQKYIYIYIYIYIILQASENKKSQKVKTFIKRYKQINTYHLSRVFFQLELCCLLNQVFHFRVCIC